MHIVTKFLVVFAAILSILLAGLTVAYTSNADRLVSENRRLDDQVRALNSTNSEKTSQLSAEREAYQQRVSALEAKIGELSGQLSSLANENARLTLEANELKQSTVLHAAQIDDFATVARTYAELNQRQAEQLAQLRDKELMHSHREIELIDRINDLTGQLEVAHETNRSLQERVVELTDQIERGSNAVAAGSTGQGFLKPPVDFRSSVTAVREDPSGRVLVQIAAGTNDRLREDMKLMIVRQGFLANVILERVDENESVGRVDFVGRTGIDIRVGDRVIPTL